MNEIRITTREPKGAAEKRHRSECPCVEGIIRTAGGQDCVYCVACNAHLYNAPKTETGRAVRSTTTVHNGVKPKQRARVIALYDCRCAICNGKRELQVGHIVSVALGLTMGLTETELNADENLLAQCAECNLGLGSEPLPMKLLVTNLLLLMRARAANVETKSEAG